MTRSRNTARWPVALAAVGLLVATPLSVAWMVGDLTQLPDTADLDYAMNPPDVSSTTERVIGITATAAVAAALALAEWATVRGKVESRWWAVLAPILLAGALVGMGWRVLTAGVIGANIGAGLMVMVGGPVVVVLLLWALVYSLYLSLRRP